MQYIKYLFLLCSVNLLSQTLNVPARQAAAMNGAQFVTAITPLSFTGRENLIMQEILNGNVPNFYRTLAAVTSTAVIGGVTKSLTYYVIPDYLAIGTDTNYFLCPMSPIVATKIADSIGCTLPTRKMVNDIYAQAALKLTPLTIPASGTMTTVQAFAQHNGMVGSQRSGSLTAYPLGTLTGGDKKDIIISNQIYTTANRVIIYGWHTSIGNPIQPLTNVHADTYMDYSHGMRFVQNSVMYNGSPTTVKAILQSSSLNTLLSDEGVISIPEYPYGNPVTSLSVPKSFAVINKLNNTLEIKVKNDNNATHYKVYISTNGNTFGAPVTLAKAALILTGLTANQPYYVKIASYNSTYSVTSAVSELLAAVPSSVQDTMLFVNGFDRVVTGNTFDFVKQHSSSLFVGNHCFSSATNESVQDGLVSLANYKGVDWILGKESTVDETFNTSEQTLVSFYLKQGGNLLVSGSEIAWDLDHSGTTADKFFISNYLKVNYVSDAPNNQASAWYKSINEQAGSIFNLTDTVYFDNGTHGTYNVDYPDVISAANNGTLTMHYTSAVPNGSAVYFKGIFTGGIAEGKVVYLAFPFETVYDGTKRNGLMKDVWAFFFIPVTTNTTVVTSTTTATGITNTQNDNAICLLYPNPAKNILNITCNELIKEITLNSVNGSNSLHFAVNSNTEAMDVSALAAGIYFITVKTNTKIIIRKFVKESD